MPPATNSHVVAGVPAGKTRFQTKNKEGLLLLHQD
jgi:hypothetical protein